MREKSSKQYNVISQDLTKVSPVTASALLSLDTKDTHLAKESHYLKIPFLKTFSRVRAVYRACAMVGVSRATVERWRKDDPAFATAYYEIQNCMVEALESTGFKRAQAGSDQLLQFFLRAWKPKVYAETIRNEVSGRDGRPIKTVSLDLSKLDADTLKALTEAVDKQRAASSRISPEEINPD